MVDLESPDVPAEMAQEVWDALKEELYEQVEQLPLSLHRSFALIGEQDKEVEACRAELLPTIRSYIKLRQSLHHEPSQLPATQDVCEDINTILAPHGMEAEVTSLDYSGLGGDNIREESFKTEHLQGDKRPTSRESSNSLDRPSRTQGLRETDASVPKSAPFPPRSKPKTTVELLTRIAFLMGELIRASEEKVGLATAVYDLVDRHVRVLDAAIKEQESVTTLGREGTRSGVAGADSVYKLVVEDNDEEPQLGIVGPNSDPGVYPSRPKVSRKRVRQDKRTHLSSGNFPSRLDGAPLTANQGFPVDPHEPRYCYCHQVSYGEMIACDNPDCSREWFHLGCAGLSAPPKGRIKWYCRDCEEALRRNRKRNFR